MSAICGGQHQSKTWTDKQIKIHCRDPCIDCYCGIPFKMKGSKIKEEKVLVSD